MLCELSKKTPTKVGRKTEKVGDFTRTEEPQSVRLHCGLEFFNIHPSTLHRHTTSHDISKPLCAQWAYLTIL